MKSVDRIYSRIHHTFGPLTAGLILDFFDIATFGPIGLMIGPFVGFGVGWWLAALEGASTKAKIGVGIVAAVYMTIPFTAVLPLATLLSSFARFSRIEHSDQPSRSMCGPNKPLQGTGK